MAESAYGRQGDASLSALISSMSLNTLQWEYAPIHGEPYRQISTSKSTKAFYISLADTSGALENVVPLNLEETESQELEQLISTSIGSRNNIATGWPGNYWHSSQLLGIPRQSRVSQFTFRPKHLDYAVHRDRSTFVVKKALTVDEYERVRYPYVLSNLISLACSQNKVSGASLRHLGFYNIVNERAWLAMANALSVAGIRLPVLSDRDLLDDQGQSHAGGPSHSGGRKAKPKRREASRVPSVWIRINAGNPEDAMAWSQLHMDNPFTRTADGLADGEINGLGPASGYTLIAVAQPRQFAAPQQYWSALVAHFDRPDVEGKAKGKEPRGGPSSRSHFAGGPRTYY